MVRIEALHNGVENVADAIHLEGRSDVRVSFHLCFEFPGQQAII